MSTTISGNDAFQQANQPKLEEPITTKEDLTIIDILSSDAMKIFSSLAITDDTIAEDPLFSAAAEAFYAENNYRVENSPESKPKLNNVKEAVKNLKKMLASLSLATTSRQPDAEKRWGIYPSDLKRSMQYGNAMENSLAPSPDAGLQKLRRILRSNISKDAKIKILLILLADVYYRLHQSKKNMC
ncbi:unnamed protein product [Hymenolepis diminuta]|nr:unnamed protein product [Hymenolepis diminuta]